MEVSVDILGVYQLPDLLEQAQPLRGREGRRRGGGLAEPWGGYRVTSDGAQQRRTAYQARDHRSQQDHQPQHQKRRMVTIMGMRRSGGMRADLHGIPAFQQFSLSGTGFNIRHPGARLLSN